MSLFQFIRRLLGKSSRQTVPKHMLIEVIEDLAFQEQRLPEEVAYELMTAGLSRLERSNEYLNLWNKLTPREQEVAALACLEYSNIAIARELSISAYTVKTHIHNILVKLELQNRQELRVLFKDWDFKEWYDTVRRNFPSLE